MGVDETGCDKTPGCVNGLDAVWRRSHTDGGNETSIDRKPTVRQFLALVIAGGEKPGRVNDEIVLVIQRRQSSMAASSLPS